MAATAGVNAGFTYGWAVGATWDINPNWALLDSQFMLAVISMALTTPPSNPAAGDRYSIPATGVTPPGGTTAAAAATGAWTNYNGYVARYTGVAWEFTSPKEGWRARNRADSRLYHADGAGNWLPTNAVASVSGVAVTYNSTTFGIRQLDFGSDFIVTDTGSGYIQIRYGARVQVNDASASILATARQVSMIALSASRTLNLPAASAFPQGATLTIEDESGACSPTVSITVAAAGTDTVNGLSSYSLVLPFDYIVLESNGASKWTIVAANSASMLSVNGGSVAGFRNRIINGNFSVNQRVYVSGASLASGVYAHDRWKAGSSSTAYTFTTGTPDTAISISSGSLLQIIENVNMEGGAYTLSWTGTAVGSITYTQAGASSTTTLSGSSPLVILNAAVGVTATVSFATGTLSKVQFEPGIRATPFERRFLSVELNLCLRYFCKSYNPSAAPGSTVATSAGSIYVSGAASVAMGGSFSFPALMRAVPTITFYDNSGNTGCCAAFVNNASAWSQGHAAVGSATVSSFHVQINDGASAISINLDFAANSEL